MSDVCRAIVFRGRVQGVGFRWMTAKAAERFAVRGWVRNEPDGSVRCEVAGEPHEVTAFLDAVEAAMPGHVDHRDEVATSGGDMPAVGVEIRRGN